MSSPPGVPASAPLPPPRWLAGVPLAFVLLWSTGFIGAKLGLPYAEPFTFLTIRFGIVIALLVPLALILRAPWPRSPALIGHLAVSGLLVHGGYLGGVFAAIDLGVSAGITALIVGLQPVLTAAVIGPLLGETVRLRQWVGLLLGLIGVGLVVAESLLRSGFHLSPLGLGWAVAALLAITGGTLYQKRHCTSMDLRTGTVIQYAAAALLTGLVALMWEERRIVWSGEFLFALGWLVVVLSIGAISLLMTMIRYGEVSRVASFFYLVPPVTAITAFLLFDERLGLLALAGLGVAVAGVALVVRKG